MSTPCFFASVRPPEPARAIYRIRQKQTAAGKPAFDDVTRRVARLEIDAAGGDADSPHHLRRLDADGHLVWQTTHPSLQEALWQGEWEYDLKPAEWQRAEAQV